jgi:RND superfamily putative drug exporter
LIESTSDSFARLGLLLVRFRWPVLATWIAVLVVAGGLLAPRAPKALKGGGFIDSDSESATAATLLDREFNASTFNNAVVVFRSTTETIDDPDFKDQVSAASDRLTRVPGVRQVQTYFSSANPLLVSPDRRTTIAIVPLAGDEGSIQEVVPGLRAALTDVTLEHYVTGTPALNHDLQTTSEQDLQRSEIFTVPIVGVLLLLVFRTVVAALLPLVVGAASIVLALAAMYLVSTLTDVSIFALNVTTMIGLGLGIDFSLVVASRFREELGSGRTIEDALAVTMATAGRSIAYSTLTVLLAMLVLTTLFNLFIVRSISLGVMIVACTGVLVGLTLLPVILAILGPRLEWLRVMPRPRAPDPRRPGAWYRLSYAIMRRPWVWLGASLLALLVMALPLRELRLYGSEPSIMPSRIESTRSAEVLNDVFGANRLTPIQVILRSAQPDGVWRPEFLAALARIGDWAANDPRNEAVFSLASLANAAGVSPEQFRALTLAAIQSVPGASQLVPQFVNTERANDTAVITIFSKYDRFSSEHQAFISDLRDRILPAARQPGGVAQTYVGGDGAIFVDFRDATARRFPVLVLGVALATFVMLMMFFQSVFLPLKAILLNFASICSHASKSIFTSPAATTRRSREDSRTPRV